MAGIRETKYISLYSVKQPAGKAFIDKKDVPIEHKDEKGNSFLGKMSSMIGKVLDCCRE